LPMPDEAPVTRAVFFPLVNISVSLCFDAQRIG
jgi:hypothetical protein